MTTYKDYKLWVKQAIIYGVILVLMAGVEGFLIYRMTVLRAEIDTITSKWLPSAVASASIKSSASMLRSTQLQLAIARDDATRKRLKDTLKDLIAAIEANQDEYETLINTPEQLAIYRRFERKWEPYQDLSFEFFSLVDAGEEGRAVKLLTDEGGGAFREFSAVLDTLVAANESASTAAAHRTAATYARAKRISWVVLIVALVIATVLVTLLVRLITVPVTQLARAAEAVAAGNVDVELEVHADDEIGGLARSFNQMTASLRRARNQIMSHQAALRESNAELESKNSDLEDAMKRLREAQQQLVMREKMASLGNLVAGVAHEINNPVGAVKSAADTSSRSIEVVRKTLEDGGQLDDIKTNRRFQAALQVLKSNNDVTLTASERIAAIVRSLKNFARLDEAEFQDANIHDGLDSTLTLLHHAMKNRIAVEKDYGDLPEIPCYPNQLNQVFMNVLSNAEQAIADKGVVRIATKRQGNRAVIEISDSGKGIAPDKLERIFDPGYTTKGVGVGTGLGLSISYNIIEQHNGGIVVRSEPGQGTTVTITLPIEQTPGRPER